MSVSFVETEILVKLDVNYCMLNIKKIRFCKSVIDIMEDVWIGHS